MIQERLETYMSTKELKDELIDQQSPPLSQTKKKKNFK
jgi:hypothetical protein